MSSEVKVILRYVTVETSGAFTCEVMADESFETVRRSKNMTVIDPPDGPVPGTVGPIIEVSGAEVLGQRPLEYHTGKTFEALCVARRAFPAAELTWTINGREAAKDFVTRIHARQENRLSFTSQLWLTFSVSEGLFDRSGRLVLVCNASLGPFYHTNTTTILYNPLLRRAHNSGLFSAGFSSRGSVQLITSSLICLLIVLKGVLSPQMRLFRPLEPICTKNKEVTLNLKNINLLEGKLMRAPQPPHHFPSYTPTLQDLR